MCIWHDLTWNPTELFHTAKSNKFYMSKFCTKLILVYYLEMLLKQAENFSLDRRHSFVLPDFIIW